MTRLGSLTYLALLPLALALACGDSTPAAPDAGAPQPDAAIPSCTTEPTSYRLGHVGAIFDPLPSVAATDQLLVVAWKQVGGDDDDAIYTSAIAQGAEPPAEPTLLASPPMFQRQAPVVIATPTGFIVAWNETVGTGDLDFEVWYRLLDTNGAPLGDGPTSFGLKPEAIGWSETPRQTGDQAWLWTMTGDEQSFTYRLRSLADLSRAPLSWSADTTPDAVRYPRLVVLQSGFGLLYERSDAEGVFFEALGTDPAPITGTGARLGTAPGLKRTARVSNDRIAIGQEDFVDVEDSYLNRVGMMLLDDSGTLLAEPVVKEFPESAGMPGMYFVDTLFTGDEVELYWVERAYESIEGGRIVLTLYRASFATSDGSPRDPAAAIQQLDQHADSYDVPGITSDYLDSGSEAAVALVGEHLATIYGVYYTGPESDDYRGTDLYLDWRCAQ